MRSVGRSVAVDTHAYILRRLRVTLSIIVARIVHGVDRRVGVDGHRYYRRTPRAIVRRQLKNDRRSCDPTIAHPVCGMSAWSADARIVVSQQLLVVAACLGTILGSRRKFRSKKLRRLVEYICTVIHGCPKCRPIVVSEWRLIPLPSVSHHVLVRCSFSISLVALVISVASVLPNFVGYLNHSYAHLVQFLLSEYLGGVLFLLFKIDMKSRILSRVRHKFIGPFPR